MIESLDTVFLDRDGVINRRLPADYVKTWSEFEFLPRVKDALKLLTDAGLRLIIVTNQRGIARGLMTERDLQAIHARMRGELADAGAEIAAIYHCPHDRDECECRKPLPGLLLAAQRDFPAIDFARAVMIGDAPSDIKAGKRAGCRTIFVGSGAGDGNDNGDFDGKNDGGAELCAATLYDAALLCLR